MVLQGGIALPPYYFHAGGVREFLSCVEDYATLIKYDFAKRMDGELQLTCYQVPR